MVILGSVIKTVLRATRPTQLDYKRDLVASTHGLDKRGDGVCSTINDQCWGM
ncbi:MAG: hypothetical protein NVS3B14_14810 [Ktedonobacteraceae bacterium]